MNCAFDRERLSLLITGSLSEQEREEIETHLTGCADCRMELKSYRKLWSLMEEVPAPALPHTMRAGFQSMLAAYKDEIKAPAKPLSPFIARMRSFIQLQPRPGFAFSFILLAIGLTAGWLLHRPAQQSALAYNRQIDSLSAQVSEMKQMMMLSLLENPSASQRIQAVGYTDEIGNVNKKVIDALLTTLNEDPNVNVRLITLEALAKLSNSPSVREGLIKSIAQQESPLLQSAIADIMVKLQERRSIQSLKQLLNKKDLNEMVRLKIEQSIHKLT